MTDIMQEKSKQNKKKPDWYSSDFIYFKPES